MLEKRKRKGFALLLLLTLGVLAAILFPKMNQAVADWMIRQETEQILRERENNRLMLTLPLMDAHELEGLTQVSDLEISALELNGYPAPVDEQTGTVYLPQAAGNLGGYDQLQGKITASSRDYQLYVLREPVLENLPQAVEQGADEVALIVGQAVGGIMSQQIGAASGYGFHVGFATDGIGHALRPPDIPRHCPHSQPL